MSCSEDDSQYVCTLDEESIKKAAVELSEDPKERLNAVKAFRQWIATQKHFASATDTLTLLAFLRGRKFCQLDARKLLEDFISAKTKLKDCFQDLDPCDPKIQAVLKDGLVFTLKKKDKESRTVVINLAESGRTWEGKYKERDVHRAVMCITFYLFFSDESTQVNGVVCLSDMTGFTMRHQQNILKNMDQRKTFYGGWNKCVPARFKKFWLYNAGLMGDFVFSVMSIMMPGKIQQRMQNLGSVLENIYKELPMEILPVEYLPDDYKGPNGGTVRENIDRFIGELTTPQTRERIKYLSSSRFTMDESKRPKDSENASFRRLNVD